MTALSDKAASRLASGFARLGASGTVTTGVGTASPVATAVALVGPVNDIERYTATGADTKTTATFFVQTAGLPSVPRNGDQIAFSDKTYAVVAVGNDGIHGVGLVLTLDVEEIGND